MFSDNYYNCLNALFFISYLGGFFYSKSVQDISRNCDSQVEEPMKSETRKYPDL